MAFRSANFAHLARFNSTVSSEFLEFYDDFVDNQIINRNNEPKSKTFAPSSIRCNRIQWFRLRGVEPDLPKSADRVLDFTAEIGTACHRWIQRNLKESLGDNWIDVEDYLATAWRDNGYQYNCTKSDDGYETLVEIVHPYPIKFACDGIIRWKGKLYLLEIKSSEFSSFDDLTDPKEEHVPQINCYASLLNLHDVLVLYIDRQYGGLKCYEKNLPQYVLDDVKFNLDDVLDHVKSNLAPDGLPKGDPWCSSSRCIYYKKCKSW